jgi:uncharacterized membrane protein
VPCTHGGYKTITLFDVSLLIAAFLCALTAGLLFAFAVVVMPGIRDLPDRDFLRVFTVMDRVIQQNEPRFLLVWAGSVLSLLGALLIGVGTLAGTERLMLIGAAAVYLLCVQLPTVAVNVPLNNRLQTLDLDVLDAAALRAARAAFEGRWNRWNAFRTVFAGISAGVLLVLIADA